jgi:16S rRNA (cytosine1402-N4)-methyltransferase
LGPAGTLIGLDVDPSNLVLAAQYLAGAACRIELRRANFAEARSILDSIGVARVDVLFADLGVSSTQLDDAERGFSFQQDGPLDMRMDSRLEVTAADLVNGMKERELGDLLYHNAQEMASRRIAKRICEARREGRITTTGRLARIVASAAGVDPASRKAKIHPATRTFLALRMAVNDEIGCLESLLNVAPDILSPGGRFGVVAFHSVEDRPVKLDFRKRKNDGIYRIVTKRPVVADAAERKLNPRSRSAKLRVAVRLPEE